MVEGGGFLAREAESEATNQRGWFRDGILDEFFANFTFHHIHSFCHFCQSISVAQLAERQAELMTFTD